MASTYARKVGFSGTDTIHSYPRSTGPSHPSMDIKPKVTSGLGTTHGLKKLEGGNDINQLLKEVSNYKFKDYFLDFDRLRKGFVSETRFRSGLGMVNAEFSDADIQSLVDKYREDAERINYTEFCADVDK